MIRPTIAVLALMLGLAGAAPAGAAVVDFENCVVGTECFPQPFTYAGVEALGEVVDLGGNNVFRLADGMGEDNRRPILVHGSVKHIVYDPPTDEGTDALAAIIDVQFDIFMPTGGYIYNPSPYWHALKTIIPAGEWVTYRQYQETINVPEWRYWAHVISIRGGDAYIDNVSYDEVLHFVPEPSTWALLIVGFGALGISARRRRAHA